MLNLKNQSTVCVLSIVFNYNLNITQNNINITRLFIFSFNFLLGGMQDTQDKNLAVTALRETEEELGLSHDDIELWGPGNLIITRYETSVLPFAGLIKGEITSDRFRVNADEVELVFTVPIEDLCNKKKIGYTQFRGSYSLPVFMGGPLKIWGLTAMITHVFLHAFIPNKGYVHKVQFVPEMKMGMMKSLVS